MGGGTEVDATPVSIRVGAGLNTTWGGFRVMFKTPLQAQSYTPSPQTRTHTTKK